MRIDFTGQTALVTGASRGIGHQIARDLAASGADLIVTSTRPDDRERLEETLGPGTRHVAVDLADPDGRDRFLDQIRTLPSLDVLVNNAGLTRHGPAEDASESDWDVTNTVNLKGPYLISQAAADVMRTRQYGRIINIGSIWGQITMTGRSIYSATKYGLRGMSISYALELARHGILVNIVAPGFTLTDMVRRNYSEVQLQDLAERIPLGRLARPDDISRVVLFLASDLNTYVTGQHLLVDGGYSIA